MIADLLYYYGCGEEQVLEPNQNLDLEKILSQPESWVKKFENSWMKVIKSGTNWIFISKDKPYFNNWDPKVESEMFFWHEERWYEISTTFGGIWTNPKDSDLVLKFNSLYYNSENGRLQVKPFEVKGEGKIADNYRGYYIVAGKTFLQFCNSRFQEVEILNSEEKELIEKSDYRLEVHSDGSLVRLECHSEELEVPNGTVTKTISYQFC